MLSRFGVFVLSVVLPAAMGCAPTSVSARDRSFSGGMSRLSIPMS